MLLISGSVIARDQPAGFHKIQATVLNGDGSPAAGREVALIGLARGSTRPFEDDEPQTPGWIFTTSEEGRFTANLGEFNTWEDKPHRPGWGNYVFVVLPSETDAGAVSSHFLNYPPGQKIYARESDEWKYEVVPPESLSIVLQLKTGFTIKGRVVEYPHGRKPLAQVEVTVNTDLYSESHTGRGGEVFWQSTTTDEQGNFEFNHVYPANACLKLADAYWLRTRHGERWLDDAKDMVALASSKNSPNIEIMASKKPVFLYRGKVSDISGNPISNAKVTFGVSYHQSISTFADDHSYQNTTTQPDGTFEILLPTPWLRGMSVEAEGYERTGQWKEKESELHKPGSYNFTLKPKIQPAPSN